MQLQTLFQPPIPPQLLPTLFVAFVLLALWSIIIKGLALWYASRNGQKKWFVALLVVNTVGLLEIIYLVWFRPRTSETSSGNSVGGNSPSIQV